MGGSLSHEYQYLTDIGDNTLLKCSKCDFGANVEQSGEINQCPKCNNGSLKKIKGIEVSIRTSLFIDYVTNFRLILDRSHFSIGRQIHKNSTRQFLTGKW